MHKLGLKVKQLLAVTTEVPDGAGQLRFSLAAMENRDLVAGVNQWAHDIRANKTRATDDENAHGRSCRPVNL